MKHEEGGRKHREEIRNQKPECRKQKAWGVEARGHLLVLSELHKLQEVALIQLLSRSLARGGVLKKKKPEVGAWF